MTAPNELGENLLRTNALLDVLSERVRRRDSGSSQHLPTIIEGTLKLAQEANNLTDTKDPHARQALRRLAVSMAANNWMIIETIDRQTKEARQ